MRPLLKLLILPLVVVLFCSAAIGDEQRDDPLPFDLNQWMSYQNRKDFPIKVSVLKPYLTFQQRLLVRVRTAIETSEFPEDGIDPEFHLVMRVASKGKDWYPGYSYTNVAIHRIQGMLAPDYYVDSGLYVRPGSYRILLIVYDSVSGRGNVLRKEFNVSSVKGAELRDLDRYFPQVEFATDPPLASGREWLPVSNSRCLCIDIVANAASGNNTQSGEDFGKHSANPLDTLQVASVLSHLALLKGSIRVTIVDALQAKTHSDREDAVGFDWQSSYQALMHQEEPDTIDYGTLQAQTEASGYLHDRIRAIIERDDCARETEQPLKIVIIVSGPLQFPARTPIRPWDPQDFVQDSASLRLFYFRIMSRSAYYEKGRDDLRKMLEPVEPQTIVIKDPGSFREALVKLISQFEKF